MYFTVTFVVFSFYETQNKGDVSLLNQKTIKKSISFQGIGLHSGKIVNVNLKSSEPDTGIVFKRIDLKIIILFTQIFQMLAILLLIQQYQMNMVSRFLQLNI